MLPRVQVVEQYYVCNLNYCASTYFNSDNNNSINVSKAYKSHVLTELDTV